MGKEQRFLVVKNKDSKMIKYFEYDKLHGYVVKPNPNLKFQDAINVNSMILINPTLIEKMVDRKIKKRFDYLIKLLSFVCDNEGSDEAIDLALNEASKFRQEVINKYKAYISQEKLDLLLKKITILEDELKLRKEYKIAYYEMNYTDEMEQGKSR